MKRVIILLGPTGVGKTGASILLAKALGTEIISADSMQIYRGMDIGTAKPSLPERSGVRHHMIDIVDPSVSFSTGQFIRRVTGVIGALHEKGKAPVIVGGTGLYIKAITRGIFSGPSADWALREELIETERGEKGALYSYLSGIDPEAAERIGHNDTRRVIRAIEVCLKSGDKMSLLQEKRTRPLPYDFIKIGLTRERKELYGMIERRVEKMIGEGLVGEVERLLGRSPDRTPLQAIGYKEIASHLSGDISLEEAVRLVKRNTRRYAKRQYTWFRREEGIRWLNITGIYTSEEVFAKIKEVLE
ncbi:MAG: tRNA (adenosine(37)-N6)-dimethylallyltransferase MiaA [Nitrospiraceae bacterium]|nr:tRNA (adenosine(37)-N6)-dimethylallyltransferase MiaA [Nitrospiraceae bacterium]